MKKYYRHYMHGFPNASEIRNQLMNAKSLDDTIFTLSEIRQHIREFTEQSD